MPNIIIGTVWLFLLLISAGEVVAVTVASQNQSFVDQLNVWQALQELGNNLSGTAASFTFRVSTSKTNLAQFDFTIQNSKIYDKDNNNSYISACAPPGYSPADPLGGLTFTTSGVPAGYEDVIIDFSCRNYNFIPGHRYLIVISNANMAQFGGKRIQFASSAYGPGGHGGADQFTMGGLRYAFDNGFCSASSYVWNSQSNNNGCNIFTSAKDDLYFVLNNNSPPPPPPKLPVIFIPGIGGSEMQASQDIVWSKDDGHGGIYSRAYSVNEKIWVNQDEATKLGDDDYFDVLRLKADGVTSEADLSLTGNLTQSGYGEIDSFFTSLGYTNGNNFFVFPYDWRKDIRSNKDSLDSLIEQIKTTSGQSKVNIIAHSMGGLIARYYISDPAKASKVNILIELGVPHLGAPYALKTLLSGASIVYRFKFFEFPIIPSSEIKDVIHNLPSAFQLLPSNQYFGFYNDSSPDFPYPFRDDRNIDNNNIIGTLNFDQTKSLLSNLNHNMTVFSLAEQFHSLDSTYNQTNGVKIYEIVGAAQPTLGQIHETWWITWPVNLIPKTDEIYINGDDTVPLYSASLKNDSLDLSGAAKIYYVDQRHADLVSSNGLAMQTVKTILNDDNNLPVEVKDQKIFLEGHQLSLDDGELDLYDEQNRHCGINDKGEIEENIPDVICTASGNTKHAFVKKKSSKIKVKATRKKAFTGAKTTSLKSRTYRQDKVSKTTLFKDIPFNQTAKVEFSLDPAQDSIPSLSFYADEAKAESATITPTSEVSGDAALDQTPPSTLSQISGSKVSAGLYSDQVTVSLSGNDSGSGVLKIEYSLDNGQSVQTYTNPFSISAAGKTNIIVKSIDKSGNEEIPQTLTVEIAVPSSSSSGTSSSDSSANSANNSNPSTSSGDNNVIANPSTTLSVDSAKQSFDSPPSSQAVLAINFENPSHVSDEINVSHMLDEQKNSEVSKITSPSATQILSGLLIVSASLGTLAAVGLGVTFMPAQALSAAKATMSLKPLKFLGKTSFVKPFPK